MHFSHISRGKKQLDQVKEKKKKVQINQISSEIKEDKAVENKIELMYICRH